jgi:hypothetical protein
MPTIYQVARQGSLTPRFAITDETGLPRFEAEGRERCTVEVADGEDAVVMLAVVLAIERIREERAHAAAAG